MAYLRAYVLTDGGTLQSGWPGAPCVIAALKPKQQYIGPQSPPGTLGDLSSTVSSVTSSLGSSPFLYVGLGLLGLALFSGVRSRIPIVDVKKRRRPRSPKTTSTLQTAILAAGAGAGGYLVGKYSGI